MVHLLLRPAENLKENNVNCIAQLKPGHFHRESLFPFFLVASWDWAVLPSVANGTNEARKIFSLNL